MNTHSAVQFCATGKRGVGHLRRIANIARPLHARGHRRLDLVTNAPVAGIDRDEIDIFHRIDVTPRERFTDVLKLKGHVPVVVDTARISGLASVSAPLVLILREARECKLRHFRLESDRPWDQVLVPNPESYWQIPTQAINATRIDYVGWIFRNPSASETQEFDDVPSFAAVDTRQLTVVIASGGGGHVNEAYRQTLLNIVEELRKCVGHRVHIVQAIGPRSGPHAKVDGVDEVRDFGSALHRAFAEADIVISTAGYNSVLEIATTTTPALLVAADTTYDDQQARAVRWGKALGHGHVELRHSLDWLVDCVTHYRPRAAVDLGPSGAEQVADHIEAIMQ